MHLTIYLDILNYVEAISLQTAVEVVQIVYAAYFACSSIEEFGRDGLAQRISFFTVLLVTGHEVISLFHNHLVESRNLIRGILKIGIHGDDNIALGFFETTEKCWALSIVSAEFDTLYLLILLGKFFNDVP